jgi:hypothetical protein
MLRMMLAAIVSAGIYVACFAEDTPEPAPSGPLLVQPCLDGDLKMYVCVDSEWVATEYDTTTLTFEEDPNQ